MEHLVFQADEPSKTVSASREPVLKEDWLPSESLVGFLPLKTPWLGFDHDAMPFGVLTEYPDNARFNPLELWNANFCESQHDFKQLSNARIGGKVAAFFQAWLYYGLLESIVGKKIHVSYLMRHDVDSQGYLYSRNLHFCLQAKVFEIRANPEGKAQTSTKIQLDILLVQKWIARFAAWSHPSFRPKLDEKYPGFMNDLEVAIPAIVRLAEVVERMRLYALPSFPTIGTLTWQYPFRVTERRRLRLRGLGWCSFQIRLLEDTVNHSTID